MSDYPDGTNLDVLDVATPIDGASAYELAEAVRQIKVVLKAVIQHSHKPNGALKGGTITELGAASVGTTQLVDGAVTAGKLGTGSVVTGKIGTAAVTADKLGNGCLMTVHFSSAGVTGGGIPTSAFKTNSIPLSALQATLTGSYLGDGSVATRHLEAACVTDEKVSGVGIAKLSGGVDGQFLFRVAGVWTAVSADGSLSYDATTGKFSMNSGLAIAYFGDVKASGTPGGAGTTDTWTQRVIAEMADMDQADIVTFNSNFFILDPGTYLVHVRTPASGVGNHKCRLMKQKVADGSDPTVVSVGSNSAAVTDVQTDSVVDCYLVVTDALWKYYVEHWIETGVGTSDYGIASSTTSTSEVYTQGYVIKVA